MNMEEVVLENIWANWHIEELIGSGSFGSVYKARRSGYGFEHDFYSAVKVIRVPADDSEIRGLLADGMTPQQVAAYYDSALKNIVNEIEVMETLKGSPNIVTIEDYEVRKNEKGIGWTIYIRMELLKNLNQYRTEHPLSVDDIVHLGIDMCSALEYCMKKNIVHRDIKPDNIFVNEFGDFKLGDFGIARHLEMTAIHLSQKGTSAYMAPEIYRGESYNGSVDIYSLGIVLYRLLNLGRLPFMPPYPQPISYEDTEAAMTRRLSGEPLLQPAQGGKLLGDIIRRAASADVRFRYASPTDMKNDLYRWQTSGKNTEAAMGKTGTIPVFMNAAQGSSNPVPMQRQTQRNIWGPEAGGQSAFMPEFDQQKASVSGSGNSLNQSPHSIPKGQPMANVPQKTKKSSTMVAVVLCCVIGVVVLFAGVFFLVPVGYETLFSKVMYNISDTDTRFNSAMKKGDNAYADQNYEKALYYYEDKALKENPKSLEAWISVLKTHTADTQASSEKIWNYMISDLEAIGNLQAVPDASGQQEIINAVNVYMDAQGEALAAKLSQEKDADIQNEVQSFFDKYGQCTDAAGKKVDCGSDNARWYSVFYDILAGTDGCEEYAVSLLAEGFEKYPEDSDIAKRQGKVDEAQTALGYEQINKALSEGDFDAAYELAEEMQQTLGQEEYANLKDSIDYIKERTDFLKSLKSMLDVQNYDGIAKAIKADSATGIVTCYLVDGVYTGSVANGTALLYDSNGLYYGQIQDGQRKGTGLQLKYYSNGSYQLLDGTWDGNANGSCTYTWWTSDGTKAVVTGNFTDGYEDGTMTITWHQDGRDWTAQYPANKGTYTEIKKDESGASVYVIAYDDDGSSAWWSTTQLTGNGCFIN